MKFTTARAYSDATDGADVAPKTHGVDDKYVPYGMAGAVVDGVVVCADCATDDELADADEYDAIFGNVEWDAPGATCSRCLRVLDTRVVVYPNGPGSDVYDDFDD